MIQVLVLTPCMLHEIDHLIPPSQKKKKLRENHKGEVSDTSSPEKKTSDYFFYRGNCVRTIVAGKIRSLRKLDGKPNANQTPT